MSSWHLLGGMAIAAIGIGWYALWSRVGDAYYRRAAESRWGFDRRISRRARRGDLSKEQFVDETAPRLRRQATALLLAFTVFMVLFGIFVAVSG